MVNPGCKTNSDAKIEEGTTQYSGVQHPDWVKDAIIYEINVRQYSEESSFNAITVDIPRLKKLGVDILWLMPIHPIGEVNRKGELGSYYSVKDYKDVNPEFGSMDDFKKLVAELHENDMKIIIDWVPNHSSYDNLLAVEHPDWYDKNEEGEFVSPYDWTDVIQFDYDQEGIRDYMTEALKFWLTETDIDGFRFDVAHQIPVDYFDALRPELTAIKEVFLLAEADQPFLHKKAMDMSYDWHFHHITNEIAKGNQTVLDMKNHFAYVDTAYPANSILMEFTSNHDENSWAGTAYDRLGAGVKSFAVLSFVLPGMPLIYNGQEACIDKMLKFFVKDPIEWKDCEMFGFYQDIIKLRKENAVLWSLPYGGNLEILETSNPDKILLLKRKDDNQEIVALFNFSEEILDIDISSNIDLKKFEPYFGEKSNDSSLIKLQPWDYQVFLSKE